MIFFFINVFANFFNTDLCKIQAIEKKYLANQSHEEGWIALNLVEIYNRYQN